MENKVKDNREEQRIERELPPRKKIDYNKIKHSCINGISSNLCDMISEEYGGRCGCVKRHFEALQDYNKK